MEDVNPASNVCRTDFWYCLVQKEAFGTFSQFCHSLGRLICFSSGLLRAVFYLAQKCKRKGKTIHVSSHRKKHSTQGFTDVFGCLMGLLWDDVLHEWRSDLLEAYSLMWASKPQNIPACAKLVKKNKLSICIKKKKKKKSPQKCLGISQMWRAFVFHAGQSSSL